MKSMLNKYPVFESNQVLTSVHLNRGFDYLDNQERLSRANLTGVGVICGLEVSFNQSRIQITKGYGITSEGYLAILPTDQILGYCKNYQLPEDPVYQPFLGPGGVQFDLWELLTDSEDFTCPPLNADFLKGKIALLFLELRKGELRDCSPNNCNDKGLEVTATVRLLLIAENNITNFNSGLSAINLNPIRLPRLDIKDGDVIKSYKDKLGAFLDNEKFLGVDFNEVYDKYNEKYKISSTNPFIVFNDHSSKFETNFIQYYYDFFHDVIQAYNELICFSDRNPVCDCISDENSFPRHLILGNANGEKSEYRHIFKPSKALIDPYDKAPAEESRLFTRLVEIAKQFQPTELSQNNDKEIKITPTQYGDLPLAKKAIPYYYKFSNTFAKQWATSKPCSGLVIGTNTYYSDDKPLAYHLEAYNFFRIEGHVGKAIADINTHIQNTILEKKLPIKVHLIKGKDDLIKFMELHPGLTHGAGVPPGGTFVLVSGENDIVIADFFLPYLVCEVCQPKDTSILSCSEIFRRIDPICIIGIIVALVLISILTSSVVSRYSSFDRGAYGRINISSGSPIENRKLLLSEY